MAVTNCTDDLVVFISGKYKIRTFPPSIEQLSLLFEVQFAADELELLVLLRNKPRVHLKIAAK